MHLFDFLFPPRVDEARIRDLSPEEFLAGLTPRLVPQTRPSTVALFTYSNAVARAAIHEAKYHGSAQAFSLLGSALADYLRDTDENYGFARDAVIIPIPLGSERLKKRGFNQVHEVAKRAVRELALRVDTTLLTRARETPSQVSLESVEREKNMRGAFKAMRPANPALTYILVDDVITTGATLGAAITALQKAGAKTIIPLALAH